MMQDYAKPAKEDVLAMVGEPWSLTIIGCVHVHTVQGFNCSTGFMPNK